MPELPEVEAWRRGVHEWMAGRRVVRLRVEEPTSVRATLTTRPMPPSVELLAEADALAGEVFAGSARHGKRLGMQLGTGWWLVHLGMTGRFERTVAADPVPLHGRVGWELDDGHTVWFRDARRFGAFVPLTSKEDLGRGLGPDALEPLTGGDLAARFRGRRAIKVALLDQAAIAGLGNIHAAEALWRAGIAPDTRVDRVDRGAWTRLGEAIVAQLSTALDDIPAVDDFVYVTDGGENPFAVYGREGLACPRCGEAVRRAVHGGRSTFWCGRCQPPGPG